MANVSHSALTGSDLHEPKGISSASQSQVYVANGSGGGVWTDWPSGWGYYKDNASAQTISTSDTKVTNDGADSTTDETNLPRVIRGSTSLWNTTTNKIVPITEGDSYALRVDLPVTAKVSSPTILTLKLDIGGGASPSIVIVSNDLVVTGTPPFTLSVAFPIFCSSTFVSNGGQLFASTDTGTLDIDNPGVFLSRLHAGNL